MLYACFWVIVWPQPHTCPISFTYLPVASTWVVTLLSLFLYSEPPLPCHPPSYRLRLFSSQTFSHINTPTFLQSSHTSYRPAYEDGTECSETSAYKIQMPRNYPEETIQQFDSCLGAHEIPYLLWYLYMYLFDTRAIFLGICDSCKFLIVVNKNDVLLIATSVDFFSPLQSFTKICEEFQCSADRHMWLSYVN